MRTLLLLALLLEVPPAFATWTALANSSQAGMTATLNSTGANLLTVAITSNGDATADISDLVGGNSNTWTLAKASPTYSTVKLFYSIPAHVGASHAFTIGNTSGGTNFSISASAWTGAKSSGVLDSQTASNFVGSASTIAPGSITPANTDVLVISAVDFNMSTSGYPSVDGSMTFWNGAASTGANEGIGIAYHIMATPTAINPTWPPNGGSIYWASALTVAFLAPDSSTGAPSTVRHRMIQ